MPGTTATRRVCAAVLLSFVIRVAPVHAQQADPPAQPYEQRAADIILFLMGGGAGFLMHESGHLFFDVTFDADPRLKRVHFGPVPFFAITHRADVSPRRELTIDSAGFWVQEGTSEWLLTQRPHLAREHAPLAKGVLAFNVLTAVGYGAVAFARAGPFERDTRGIAASAGVDERVIGTMVITPAVLDAIRYFKPEWTWARWASRAAKAGTVVLVFKPK